MLSTDSVCITIGHYRLIIVESSIKPSCAIVMLMSLGRLEPTQYNTTAPNQGY